MREIKVLVVAQHDNQKISADTLSTLKAAQSFLEVADNGSIDALVVGAGCQSVNKQLASCEILDSVLCAEHEDFVDCIAANVAPTIQQVAEGYTHVLMPANTFGKDILPRVAAMLNVEMLSDIMAVEAIDTVVRPIYAGNALARVRSNDSIKLVTVRSTAFDKITLSSSESAKIVAVEPFTSAPKTQLVSRECVERERPDLNGAEVVVSGGRGLGSKENFALIEQLADKLGAAIGASRAAVDAGFVTNDLQVGQTGKIVAPKLYFEVADYGLVGDLFEILPELTNSF
jgi:electron transfer flavoprotein alpha subunit